MAWLKVSFSPVSGGATGAGVLVVFGLTFFAGVGFDARAVFFGEAFLVAFFLLEAAFFFIELRLLDASARRRKYGWGYHKCQAKRHILHLVCRP